MEFLFAEDGKLITYQPIGHQWSPREREWTIVIVTCTDEEAQSLLCKVIVNEDPFSTPSVVLSAYLDNFENLDNLDLTTFSGRLVYKE